MLSNVGLSPTINYTIQDYKPDDVIIGTDISNGQIWRRDVGAYVVKDNIVIAFVNGSRYDKVVNFSLILNFIPKLNSMVGLEENLLKLTMKNEH